MRKPPLLLDAQRRALIVNGKTTVLQEKSWQVLAMLRAGAPQVVARDELIDAIWPGNYLTGEKGLNQALWIIRAALHDEARRPGFIRTIPRVGYQWIHREVSAVGTKNRGLRPGYPGIAAAAAAMLACLGGSVPAASPTPPPGYGVQAYLVEHDIFVDMSNGCRRILKNTDNIPLGQPVLSSDGKEIAVAVYKDASCRLVTIDVINGHKRDFGDCPAEVI